MSLQAEKILGLTIHGPWAELVARGLKTVENRTWPPYEWMLGRYLAIHASTRWDQEGAEFIARNHARFAADPPMVTEIQYGVIAVARLVGWVERGPDSDPRPRTLRMLEGYEFGDNISPLGHSVDWRWFQGPFGWVLRDIVRIPPVACRGMQKLWALPKPVYASVRRRFDEARKRQPSTGSMTTRTAPDAGTV